jgi:uncharacterized membrane protein
MAADDQSMSTESAGPTSLNALTRRNVEIIAELEKAANAERSPADRLADAIGQFAGSMKFVYLHVAWFSLWVAASTLPIIPEEWRFDSFPYTLLTFLVSLESIFLSTFILISQNHEERLARRRNHLDLQINLLSEQENSEMLKTLEAIAEHLQIRRNPDSAALGEATQPQEMVAQIKEAIEDDKERNVGER